MSRKVNFAEAIALGFKNYARFRGVASRSEYWYFLLFTVLVGVVLSTFDSIVENLAGITLPITLSDLANLVLFLPSLALVVRRFRDAGFTGWLVATALIPAAMFVAGVILALSDPALQSLITFALNNPDATEVEIQNLSNEVGQNLDSNAILLTLSGLLGIVAYCVFELVIKVQATKTRSQGNKYQPEENIGSTEY